MIGAQQVVDLVLEAAARLDGAVETIVLVTDRAEASLRWAGNSMTTNGVSVNRSTTVISIVRQGDSAHVGSLESCDVDPAALPALVAASQAAARSAPAARDAFTLLTGTSTPADWDAPVPGTGAEVFAPVAGALAQGFRGPDTLYGFAHHVVETTFLATSTGIRRRYTQPIGIGGDQRQAGRRQRVGGGQHPVVRRGAGRPAAGRPVDAAGLGVADGGPAGRTLRDDHAAVDRLRHDDLPLLDAWTAAARRRAAPRCRRPAAERGWGRSSPIWG